ncbi:YheT family hydrolase [Phaeodactylibacter luteus]|uniref:Alpha/beta fold hydrolase n=1 Tax=Phaeodactylibacter luteus TaxID=1564516 RepID=A0A5C6RIM0_9BACT|nr:alpha/beta fold hydrolase [Phaeodactylibacter luteus]TXB62047.1 alpha/beta fold hydrolase [Phaeodactylibacter luteus]
MPVVNSSSYKVRGLFRNRHVNTIYPAFFRRVDGVAYERERISTPDKDFLDLDWSVEGHDKLVIVLHGLEGSADRPYIRGMARYFNERGWDALGVNFRGCSGEPNWALRSYHIGETADLQHIIAHALGTGRYRHVGLIGFSLGGNVVLKYLGEGNEYPKELVGGVAFSVPCDVLSANTEIDKLYNWQYRQRFLVTLNDKMKEKAARFPGRIKLPARMPRNFIDFDDQFTAPIHGFRDAEDYWVSSSSIHFIPSIRHPALLVNAKDDSFLSESCYPWELAEGHRAFHLEVPNWGGHVGFVTRSKDGQYWTERRAYEFLRDSLPH